MDPRPPEPSWRDRLEGMAGRRTDVWFLVAVLGAIALGALMVRSRAPDPVIAPPSQSGEWSSPAPTSSSPSPPAEIIYVHVAGAVRRPGLYELPSGARVADALEAAGGARPGADVGALNLAEVLVDGAKVDVPRRGQTPAPATTPAPGAASPGASSAPIDVNTADETMLETVPGIGPVLAAAIVQHRTDVGSFESVDALLDVSGIGPATLESIRPYVTV